MQRNIAEYLIIPNLMPEYRFARERDIRFFIFKIMGKDPAFLFYSKDWITGTADFMPEEKGVYIDLLCYQHQKGSLPLEPSRLARIAGLNIDDFNRIWGKIKTKFILQDYGYINERLQAEFLKREYSAKNKKICGIFASILRKNGQHKSKIEKIKANFSVNLFKNTPNDELQTAINRWVEEW